MISDVTMINVPCRYPCFPRPLSDSKRTVIPGEDMVTASIVCLSSPGLPSTVVGRIGTIVVETFNGVLGRGLRPHISQKGCKRCLPALTDGNAATGIIGLMGISAARFHPCPGQPFWCAGHAMGEVIRHTGFLSPAATALGATQIVSHDQNDIAALALTVPERACARSTDSCFMGDGR
jgi:hypothetical protein